MRSRRRESFRKRGVEIASMGAVFFKVYEFPMLVKESMDNSEVEKML